MQVRSPRKDPVHEPATALKDLDRHEHQALEEGPKLHREDAVAIGEMAIAPAASDRQS